MELYLDHILIGVHDLSEADHNYNKLGFKITPSSPRDAVRELASALEKLYNDRPLRSRMGQAARERAEMVYHWDKLGDQLMKIYQEALGLTSDN